VTSAGTGLIAHCERPVDAPPARVAIAISNRPNPFNPATTIAYVLPVDGHARLVVYDVAGRVVRTLLNRWQSAGPHEILWGGRDDRGLHVPSGVYRSRLTVEEFETAGQMLLLK